EGAEHGEGSPDALHAVGRAGHGAVSGVVWRLGVPLYGIVPRCGTTYLGAPTSMPDENQAFDLKALADDELVEQMHNDLYDGMAPEIVQGMNILLGRGWGPDKV